MKITLLTPALVAVFGLALAGAPVTAQAQDTTSTTDSSASTSTSDSTATTPAKKSKGEKSAKTPYSGTITAIDSTSVTVASTKKTLTMTFTPTTKFKNGKTAGAQSDFAVGDAVTGSYSTDSSGGLTVNSLNKKGAKAPKAAADAPATPAAAPATN